MKHVSGSWCAAPDLGKPFFVTAVTLWAKKPDFLGVLRVNCSLQRFWQ
jgi:hypothetical protein